MSRTLVSFRSILMSVMLFSQILLVACAEHNTYRVHDGYYGDYHNWDNREQAYYLQWESESHRDHRDFQKRSTSEQNDYWKWRHSHEDKESEQNKH